MGWLTGIVVGCSSILLGLVFCHWLVDYGILWVSPLTERAHSTALAYYQDFAASPIWMTYVIASIAGLAILSLFSKLSSFSTSSILFDGGSLVLYVACASAYFTSVREGLYKLVEPTLQSNTQTLATLRNLASAHLTISVALTGVIALQAGQYFAERQLMDQTGFLDDDGYEGTVPSSPRVLTPARPSRPAEPATVSRQRKSEAAGAMISKSGTNPSKTEITLPQINQRVTRATSAALAKAQQTVQEVKPTPAPTRNGNRRKNNGSSETEPSATLTVAPAPAPSKKAGGRKRRKTPQI